MEQIKKLRNETGAGVMDAKKALEESKGNFKKATTWISKKGLAKAAKKAGRKTDSGIIHSYIHHNALSGAMIELLCETDFVASNQEFVNLAKELAMQVNSMNPKNVKEFLSQEYIRDSSLTVEELIKSLSGKLGENIQLKRFIRYELGEK
jgi:elongation factor Ts